MFYLMMIDTEEEKRKFVILYEKYKYLMLKIAYDILGDNYLAEDAVHESFIKVSKNMSKIGDIDTQETKRYLITITKNSAIDIYRKRRLQLEKEIFVDELGENNVPLAYIDTDIDNQVLDIIKNLSVKYRDVFMLKYSSKLENAEIAEILKIPQNNVRQRLARGKKIIQAAIDSLEDRVNETYKGN